MPIANATTTFQIGELAQRRAWVRYHTIARLAGFVGILCSPFAFWLLFFISPADIPFLSSMVEIPVVICGCVLLSRGLWRRDRFVRLLFGAGIALRLAAAS